MLGLSGCSRTEKAFVVDGAGFQHVPLKRESSAFLINNDLAAYKATKSNNAACARMAGCQK